MDDVPRSANWGAILTRDYLAGVEPYLGWVRGPLSCLVLGAVASWMCGGVLHPRGYIVLAGLLAVIGLGVAWPRASLLGLRGSLAFDRARAREGDAVGVRGTIRNRLPWGAWGITVEGGFLSADGPADERSALAGLACVPGLRTTEASWTFVPGCRGEYPTRVPRLASAFPFGISKASRPLAVSSRLLVWPRTFPVGPIPEAAGRSAEGFAPRDRAGTSGDIMGVRPYRRGDSLRRIHWPQTARHDQLVVCELHAHAVPRAQVVLDTHRGAHAGDGPSGSREWAIRIAASFAEDWIGQGAEVEVVVQGRAILPRDPSIQARRARVLDALARIEPDGLLTLADLLELPACRRFRGGLRVVVTTGLGLLRCPRGPSRGAGELFVVLGASSFSGAEAEDDRCPSPPCPAPCIWVDDPARVPQSVRRAWKEIAVD